ncbi:MAG: hypothetical protein GEU88_02785 [Solirubrobacterales bacterium]|nr:hypothetical protein [Solirubrobacterales bacterium]
MASSRGDRDGAEPIALIGAPFHLGHRGLGMGAGPLRLLDDGAVPAELAATGVEADLDWLADPSEPGDEIGRVFELNRRLAGAVAEALAAGRLPVIVAGNCSVCLGAVAGAAVERLGILWLDAHPDFHTPETTESGFLDGTGLAAATGACWRALCESIPGFAPVPEERVVLAGVRDIDGGEADRLARGEVTVIEGGGGPGSFAAPALERALDVLCERAEGLYVHVDLDVIDPSFGSANEYAAPGGLSPDEVRATIAAAAERAPVRAISFTAYDPSGDPEGRFAATAVELICSSLTALHARAQ